MKILDVTGDDLMPSAVALARECLIEQGRDLGEKERAWLLSLRKPVNRIALAVKGTELLGVAACRGQAVAMLYVRPAHRGTGVREALLERSQVLA